MSKPDSPSAAAVGESFIVSRGDLQKLFDALAARDFQIIAPTVRDSAIVYERIDRVEELPHQEHPKCTDESRQDDRKMRVDQAQPTHDEENWNHRDLLGDHQGCQHRALLV